MSRAPCIDLADCNDCETCLTLCPAVFARNEDTGLIEVRELSAYPEEEIESVMKMCPADCIGWEEALGT